MYGQLADLQRKLKQIIISDLRTGCSSNITRPRLQLKFQSCGHDQENGESIPSGSR